MTLLQAAGTMVATMTETAAGSTPNPKPDAAPATEALPTRLEEDEEDEEEEVAEEECVSALKLVGGQCTRGRGAL